MSKSKRIDLICMVTAVFMVLVTVLFWAEAVYFWKPPPQICPMSRILIPAGVHTVDIVAG